VKSREGLSKLIPTKIMQDHLVYKIEMSQNKLHLHNFRELKIKLLTWHYEISQDSTSVK
jgi:hypothetical protein